MSELHDRIQQFQTRDTDLLKAMDIILKLSESNDSIRNRLERAELALTKVGLHQCHLIGQWFLFPSEGMILPDGRPVSFVGLATHVSRPGLFEPRWLPLLCETLFLKHRQTIEAAILGNSKPNPMASLATALGWRLPIGTSEGAFGDWLKKNAWRLQQ